MKYVKGLVSVIIPTYKRSDLLIKAIHSILNQTYQNIELFVVNDNLINDEYSQKLYHIMNNIDDKRVRLLEQKMHINGSAARNVGIKNSRGEFIAFLDDDDWWEKSKIALQVNELNKLDNTWGAVSCLMRIYNNGNLIQCTKVYKDGQILVDILDRKTSLGTGALLIRRSVLDEVGYWDEKLYRHQDLQLFARIANKYKIKLIKNILHNRENKDRNNMPSPDKIMEIKRMYFESISDIIAQLKPKLKKRIFIMHEFEASFAFKKAGNYVEALKKAIAIFRMPSTIFLAINRISVRLVETKFRFKLEKKYKINEVTND